MCCLRYENEVYEELKCCLPRKGCQIDTPLGRGKVLDTEILRQKVTVQTKDDRIVIVNAKDIQRLNEGEKGAVD